MVAFTHDAPAQRVVFGPGTVDQIGEEATRLGLSRVLVLATPGSGARLGGRIGELLGGLCAGVHAEAVIHVPKAVAAAGLETAQAKRADGLVAVGGGSAIGLAKAIAVETSLPIIAIPTTYSGSEATALWGLSEGERKVVGNTPAVVPRTIVYDPHLTLALPASVTAASAMNAIAHCVEGLWAPGRTPITVANATEAMRRFGQYLPRAVANGKDLEARGECLVGAWLAGTVMAGGTALHHKLAHILGGYGLPHAETHAIILPHVTRFNLETAPDALARLKSALGSDDPAGRLAQMVAEFPIPERLRDVGFREEKVADAVGQVVALGLKEPRPVSADDARAVLMAAY